MPGKIFFRTETASWKIAARLVASTILDVAKATFNAVTSRRSVSTLAAWDDRMLKDIGLTRGDLDDALAQPWHRDPSRELMVRRFENRVRGPSIDLPDRISQQTAHHGATRDLVTE